MPSLSSLLNVAAVGPIVAVTALCAVSRAAHPMPVGGGEGIVYPDETDLDGDSLSDTIVLLPAGDPNDGNDCAIGEVRIVSGSTGQVITRFVASRCDDAFGSSVAIIHDLDGDGNDDLIIGAPLNGTGRAYVFLGPFGAGSGTQVILADDADMVFAPPGGIDHFGDRVGAVADLDGDGVADLRIRAKEGTAIRTFIVSGVDGSPLFRVDGSSPFSPWTRPQSDVDDDGDVDANDLAVANSHLGQSGSSVGIFQGDVNGSHSVTSVDISIITGHQGVNQFGSLTMGTKPWLGGGWGIWICPQVIPPNFHCVLNCWGIQIYLPANVGPLCDHLLCPMDSWCGYAISILGPAPMAVIPGPPDGVEWESEVLVEVGPGSSGGPADWAVTEGADLIEILEVTYDTFRFRALDFGSVRIQCTYSPCPGWCYLDIPIDIVWVDSDSDGLPDHWEFLLGLDPHNPDTDGDGIPDGAEDADGDGLSNHDEFIHSTDPANPDSDGDDVSDGDEVAQASDPNDPSDGGNAPDPDDVVDVVLQVGDDSGSHSELWMLVVGDIRFKAPGYGQVTPPTTFHFLRGKSYPIKVVHLGSSVSPPDYDYTALVTPAGPGCAWVDDPQQLLGVHWSDECFGGCDPAAGKKATLHLVKVDLDIDSDNNNGFGTPDHTAAEDQAKEQVPGKLIFTNIGDSDADGIPDFADGFDRWGGATRADDQATCEFTPVLLKVGRYDDPASVQITLSYDGSDPSGVGPAMLPNPLLPNAFEPAPGRLRLWTKKGDEARHAASLGNGGDYVPPGQYPVSVLDPDGDGKVTLYAEAVRPSASAGSDSITITVIATEVTGPCLTDTVTTTCVQVEVHDLRYWGLEANTTDILATSDLWAFGDATLVGGAITDGTSICLVRTNPKLNGPMPNPGGSWGMQIAKRGTNAALVPADDKVVGSLVACDPAPMGTVQLPAFPEQQYSNYAGLWSGMAYYIPPASYVDQMDAAPGADSVSNDETTPVEFQVLFGPGAAPTTIVGRVPFILRRPPVILIHGIMSNPGTWDGLVYAEGLGRTPVPTRVYYVDWSAEGTKGYGENFPKLAKIINTAVNEYRYAADATLAPHTNKFHGVRYAATRVDVVAHSQGGQIARLYASSLDAVVARGGSWPSFNATRPETPPDPGPGSATGRWRYLRPDNWERGDIRRLITLGSPFDGSRLAATAASILEPTGANIGALITWNQVPPGDGGMPDSLAAVLFSGETYVPPTCVADLSPGSTVQTLLEVPATYPGGAAHVRWYPIVGLASDSFTAGTLFTLLMQFVDSQVSIEALGYLFGFTSMPTGGLQLDPDLPQLSPTSSDLIVTEASQRDGVDVAGRYVWHTHMVIPVAGTFGETNSPVVADHIGRILSSHLQGISLPASGVFFPASINGVQLYVLGGE